MKYRIECTVSETYIATETVTVEVDAEDENDAARKGRSAAEDKVNLDNDDADYDGRETSINSIIAMEDENGEPVTLRCEKTPDMFEGVQP